MSLTSTEIILCNQSLDKFASEDFTYANQATSATGIRCSNNYPQTRDALLRSYNWNFAKERLVLADSWKTDTAYTTDQYVWDEDGRLYKCSTAHISTSFQPNYIYYDGTLVVYDGDPVVDSSIGFYWTLVTDRPAFGYSFRYQLPADFMRLTQLKRYSRHGCTAENGYLLAWDKTVHLSYVKKITDPSEFDPLFTECLILGLALKLVNPIAGVGGGAQNLKASIAQEYQLAMSRARTVCSNEDNLTGEHLWNEARFTSGLTAGILRVDAKTSPL